MTASEKALTAREKEERDIQRLVETRLLRVNALSFGLVAGIVAGLGLFLATNWLVLKGGRQGVSAHDVGPHLSLLSQYFIGYSVTFVGSLIGFAWAFACGLAIGWAGSWLYNAVAHIRHQRRAP